MQVTLFCAFRLSLYTLEDLRNKIMAVISYSNTPKVSQSGNFTIKDIQKVGAFVFIFTNSLELRIFFH